MKAEPPLLQCQVGFIVDVNSGALHQELRSGSWDEPYEV